MAKIPKTALKDKEQKCPICGKRFKNKAYLVSHIGNNHESQIPNDWSASRYENYLRTKKDHGSCIVCKEDTDWNESTWKYGRLCKNPDCKKAVADNADRNNMNVYGKAKLLDDPEMQRKLVYSKKNSGRYQWSNDVDHRYENLYDSSVSKSFLEMLDVFMNFNPEDVFSPSPNTYPYEYEGGTHSYIPDHYIASLNLEVEIKEPKDNQNMHPKIQAVDKVKERLKDEAMEKRTDVNYIKINGTDYREFFALLSYLKNQNDSIPNKKLSVNESLGVDSFEFFAIDSLLESVKGISTFSELDDIISRLDNAIKVSTGYEYTYKSVRDNLSKRLYNAKNLTDYINIRMEASNIKNEMKSIAKSEKGLGSHRYEAEKTINYIDTEILPKCNIEIDKMNGKKPVTEKSLELTLLNPGIGDTITLYHGSHYQEELSIIRPMSLNVDTKLSKPRMSSFWSDDKKYVIEFAIFKSIRETNPRFKLYYNANVNGWLCRASDVENIYKTSKNKVIRIYTKTFNTEYLGRGHGYTENNNEYSYDFPIKPDSCEVLTFNDYKYIMDKMLQPILPEDDEERKRFKDNQNIDINNIKSNKFMYRLVYHDINNVMDLIQDVKKTGQYTRESYNGIGMSVIEATSITASRGNSAIYRPVFVCLSCNNTPFGKVIRQFTGDEFSHASLSLDTKLNKMITFNARGEGGRNGLILDESVFSVTANKYLDHFALYMYLANEEEYHIIERMIEDLTGRMNEMKYSFKGIINIAFGKETHDHNAYFCSQFVTKVLSTANPDLFLEDSSLVTPGKLANVEKFDKLFIGTPSVYDEKEVDKVIRDILKKRGFTDVQIKY